MVAIYIVLFINALSVIYIVSKLIIFQRAYEDLEKAYVDIFVILRKRKEHLEATYPNDLAFMDFYERAYGLKLKERLIEELALRSIDDEADLFKEEALDKIRIYEEKLEEYKKEKEAAPLFHRLLAHIDYEDLSDLL